MALLVGVLVGPAVFDLLGLADLGDEETILEQAALITLAIALMGVALRLPTGYIGRSWRSLAVLLGLLMPLMWLSSSLLAYLILGLPFWVAVLIGAVVTPTDPVVSSAMVTGEMAERNLPERLRHLISAESGFNDGLAYPFVLLLILVLARPPGEAMLHWLTHTILWEVGVGAVLGALKLRRGRGHEVGRSQGNQRAYLPPHHQPRPVAHRDRACRADRAKRRPGNLRRRCGLNEVARTEAKERQEHVQDAIIRFFDLPIFVLLGIAPP